MTRSRRRYNRNRPLGIQNRVKGILKKANDLAQCYGINVDMQIQLGNFAAGYQSEPGLRTQRAIIPEDHVFGPEDFVKQNKKYDQLFSAQLPGQSASALPSSASFSSKSPLPPCVLPTRAIHAQSVYTPTSHNSNTPPSNTEEVITPEAAPPSREFSSAIQVSRKTASPSLARTTSISTQQAKDLLDLVEKIF